jgi:hypothetical protein
MWGYGIAVGTRAVRVMADGVFDAFPKLKICATPLSKLCQLATRASCGILSREGRGKGKER